MRCVLPFLLAVTGAVAQVPDSGRWQELCFPAGDVAEHAEDRYIELTVTLAAAGQLDRDRILLARVQRIADGLVRAAIELKPEAASWPWEIHITDDPSQDAMCDAGGKLLVGSAFVAGLALDDGELATLLAHEIAHAIAEHQRETLSEALLDSGRPTLPLEVIEARLDSDIPLQMRLSRLSAIQEREADQLGMVIAHRAGWAPDSMISFYRKLAVGDGVPLAASHPSSATRLSLAKGMSRLLLTSP